MKKWIVHICLAVACVIGFVAMLQLSSSYQSKLAGQMSTIQDLTTKKEQLQVEKQASERKAKEAASGVNTSRIENDDAIIEKFFKKVFNWDSYDSYMAVRESLQKDYQLENNSSFLTTFFPKAESFTAENGDVYNTIDEHGLNMAYADMTSHVVGIKTGVYSYLTEVTVTSNASNGGTGVSQCIVMYDIDTEENISNIQGYTLQS